MKPKKKQTNTVMKLAVTNLVGLGMIGATAGMVNSMSAGTAKNIAGIVPGLQSLALVNANLPNKQNPLNKSKKDNLLW